MLFYSVLGVHNNYMQLKEGSKKNNVIDIWWIYDDGGIKMQYLADYNDRIDRTIAISYVFFE